VYSTSLVPEQWRLVYAINPMVGVIESFRAGLLGTVAMPWDLIGVGTLSALLIFISGTIYFRRMERIFADVV
jgi:lipopolysaccharide transport system permease protein